MFRWENLTSHLVRTKNSSYYIAPVGDWTHDLPHTVASNMVKVSHALNHSATEAVVLFTLYECDIIIASFPISRQLGRGRHVQSWNRVFARLPLRRSSSTLSCNSRFSTWCVQCLPLCLTPSQHETISQSYPPSSPSMTPWGVFNNTKTVLPVTTCHRSCLTTVCCYRNLTLSPQLITICYSM